MFTTLPELRRPKYISPSSLEMYESNPECYFIRYMHPDPPMRDPQTEPMAIGSAFDAYVKSYLYNVIHGSPLAPGNDVGYDLDALFDAQVEPQHREWARKDGAFLFKYYEACGALGNLVIEIESATSKPQFETEISGQVLGRRESVGPFPIGSDMPYGPPMLLGKPDMYYLNRSALRVILDWKVNGWFSKDLKSPGPHFVRVCKLGLVPFSQPPAFVAEQPRQHPDCVTRNMGGIDVCVSRSLDGVDKKWAKQLAFYAWVLGTPVGETFITAIDQICGPAPSNIRIASHRNTVSAHFQHDTYEQAADLWYRCQSGHLYRDISRDASDRKLLDIMNDPQPILDQFKLPFFGRYMKDKGAGNLLEKTMSRQASNDSAGPV